MATQTWVMHPDYANPNKDFKRNYDMKEELGKGGFGTVRRCIYKAPGGQGERKELAAKINNTPEKKREMIEEAVICLNLSREDPQNPSPHPSRFIVNLFDSITEGDIVYNLYEMASGGDLNDEIARKEFFRPAEAADAIRQILQGVNHIHQRGYIHIDLKPANILIQSKSCKIYKVADFGLSKQRSMNRNGDFVPGFHGGAGTLNYKPPESFGTNTYDIDFDIWSCGVILYEMMAGYQPFWDDDANQITLKITTIALEYPSPEWDGLDDAKQMISRMLAPTVGQNQQNSRATFSQLQQCAFYQLGDQQPLPTEPADDVLLQFETKRAYKANILEQQYQTQMAQQGYAAQP